MISAHQYLERIRSCDLLPRSGKILQFYGLAVEASGPAVFMGEICEIYASPDAPPVMAEVVGFKDRRVLLMPHGSLRGISAGSEVIATGRPASVRVGPDLVGRVIDAFGRPLDGKPLPISTKEYSLYPEVINPLERSEIDEVFETGVRSIDTCLTTGKGQRMGLFAGSGVGKSSLLGMIARNSSADVNVITLVGERGREVIEFIRGSLGAEGLAKSVVVVATADEHALVRTHAAYTGTAIAEYFKDEGKDVMLAMDSITRLAMAQREIGLAVGEPATSRGYTPSSFSVLPKLVERAGNFMDKGSITAFYTVLVEGDDFNEPVADNLRAILDGHIVLSRRIAVQNQYPAIDIVHSVSRLANNLYSLAERELVDDLRELLGAYEESKDMIEVGAYAPGGNKTLDRSITLRNRIIDFLKQGQDERVPYQAAFEALAAALRGKN